MKKNNMELWSRVYRTDPSQVKEIKGKSYKGVSPKPYWLIEQATKEFGACGQGWGVEVLRSDFQQISPTDFLHTAIVRVWYIRDGVKCAIEQAGGTKASYLSKDKALIVDEDAAKKSITDGMVKCLSMIGFAGDIFSGRWDDSKHIQEVEQHFKEEKQKEQQQKPLSKSELDTGVKDISAAPDESALRQIFGDWYRLAKSANDENAVKVFTACKDERKKQFA